MLISKFTDRNYDLHNNYLIMVFFMTKLIMTKTKFNSSTFCCCLYTFHGFVYIQLLFGINWSINWGPYKLDVKSVLRIGSQCSAHNKREHPDLKTVEIPHFFGRSELKLWFIFIYEHITNQNSGRFSVSIIYFTNFAVQSVNKAFLYIAHLRTWHRLTSTVHRSTADK